MRPTSVICDDCRYMSLGKKYDLVFLDPPFNIGQEYDGYEDRREDYGSFIHACIKSAWDHCRGVLALHGPDSCADIYTAAGQQLGMQRLSWINLYAGFGQCQRRTWVDSRSHCLIYGTEEYVRANGCALLNPEAVLVPSDRVKYGDKRVHETERGGQRLPGTVWGVNEPFFGRVQGNNKERWPGHPNQLPQAYLRRLILAYTNPGDWVLDPMCGSGTTGVVCKHEGRCFTGVDVSEANAISARRRIDTGFYRFR